MDRPEDIDAILAANNAQASSGGTSTVNVPISGNRTVTIESNRVLVPGANGAALSFDTTAMTEEEFKRQLGTGIQEADKIAIIKAVKQKNPNPFKAS